jgi:hypothetical protein
MARVLGYPRLKEPGELSLHRPLTRDQKIWRSRRGDFFGSPPSMPGLAATPVAEHARLLPFPGIARYKAARGIGTPEARFLFSVLVWRPASPRASSAPLRGER